MDHLALLAPLFTFLLYSQFGVSKADVNTVEAALVLIENNADRRIRPKGHEDGPLVVNLTANLVDVYNVDFRNQEVSLTLHLKKKWRDDSISYPVGDKGPKELVITKDVADKLMWMPNIDFPAARISTESTNAAVKIKPAGDVELSTRLTMVTKCTMNLYSFPFGQHICAISMSNNYLTTSEMVMRWEKDASEVDPTMILKSNKVGEVSHQRTGHSGRSGKYEKLLVTFKLKNSYIHCLIGFYLPSFLLVSLSCVLFFLPTECLLERTVFAGFLYLSMVSVYGEAQESGPMAPHLTRLDIWNIGCLGFLTVLILVMMLLAIISRGGRPGGWGGDKDEADSDRKGRSRVADRTLSALFPCLWLTFNVVYWVTAFIDI